MANEVFPNRLDHTTPGPCEDGPRDRPEPGSPTGRPSAPSPAKQKKHRRFLRSQRLASLLDVSMATFWRVKAAGKIGPRPIRLSPGCVRYDLPEIRAWFDHRKPDGSLYSATEWPAVWAMLRKAADGHGRPH